MIRRGTRPPTEKKERTKEDILNAVAVFLIHVTIALTGIKLFEIAKPYIDSFVASLPPLIVTGLEIASWILPVILALIVLGLAVSGYAGGGRL